MEKHAEDARRKAMVIDIDMLVPKDHLLRKIEKVMDYDWLYERLNPLCQIAFGIIPINLVKPSGVGVSFPNNRLVRQPADALAACFNVRHRQIAPRLNAVYTVFYRSLKSGQR